MNNRYKTTHLIVEQLRQLLEEAGLHELSTRLRGIEVTGPAEAQIVRDVLRQGPMPNEPVLREWFDITLANVERALKPERLPAAA